MSHTNTSNLNIIGSVNTDQDAHALASQLNGSKPDPYYTPSRSLSSYDEEVHEIYENLKNIVDNSSDFSEYEISQHLAEAEDNYPYRHGRYSGNYNADLAEKDSLVYKFYTNYKRKQTLYKKTRKNRPNDLGKEIYDLISKVTEIDNES